ncbi:Hypothetical_protein [Hexamita inflata]|uniref:Hypothetical_protein n=1 Tax=Hexamita inflata TaxID=28002 RepID=A0ABP1GJI5_9EUKA
MYSFDYDSNQVILRGHKLCTIYESVESESPLCSRQNSIIIEHELNFYQISNLLKLTNFELKTVERDLETIQKQTEWVERNTERMLKKTGRMLQKMISEN